MKMNEPPANKPPGHPLKRLTAPAQVIAVLIYVAVVMVLLAAIMGSGFFMAHLIREAL
jgi:hypothetical protein